MSEKQAEAINPVKFTYDPRDPADLHAKIESVDWEKDGQRMLEISPLKREITNEEIALGRAKGLRTRFERVLGPAFNTLRSIHESGTRFNLLSVWANPPQGDREMFEKLWPNCPLNSAEENSIVIRPWLLTATLEVHGYTKELRNRIHTLLNPDYKIQEFYLKPVVWGADGIFSVELWPHPLSEGEVLGGEDGEGI